MPDDIDKTDETPEPEVDEAEDWQTEKAKMQAALKKANAEAAENRRKAKKYEDAEAERQQAEMTELDKAKAEAQAARDEIETVRAEARKTLIRSAFISEAAKQGAAYPEDVYPLADHSGVEVADDGTVTGVAEAVKSLVDSGRIPLSGKAPAPKLDGGAGGTERPGQTTRLTAEQMETARKMHIDPEAYARQLAAINKENE